MARVAYQLALESPHIAAEVVEISAFPDLAQRYQVRAVPLTVIDDKLAVPGAMAEATLVEQVLKVAEGAGLAEPGEDTGPTTPTPQPEPPQKGQSRSSGIIIP